MSRDSQVDLLLINPGNRTQIYQSVGAELAAIEPPVWLGLIGTFVRKRGFSVVALDANAEGLTAQQTAQQVQDIAPRLVAVVVYGHNPSASTQVMPAARAVCGAIKNLAPEQKVLLVGGHVASLPERTLREEQADWVCGGEGPYTVAELLEALKAGETDLRKVRGLWLRDGDQVICTPPAPLVKALDTEMPGIAWDLLPMDKYRAHNWHCFDNPERRQPYASIYTTLGCPYHCTFCCIQAPFKSGEKALGYRENVNTYRSWAVESVLAELDLLVKQYGVRNVKFADELFVLKPKHVEGICDGIVERGYDLNIWAYARVDTLRDGMVEKLKRAGINWIALGIEAADAKVRDDAQKGFDQDDIARSVAAIRAAGMYVIGNYIFGLPEDDHRTMQATLDLALDLNCEFGNFYCAMAYPGSQLYNIAIKEGWALPQEWSGYSQHAVDTLPLPTRHISGPEVLEFRDRAFEIYFRDPRYLDMVLKTFGPATVEHVRRMASHSLVRQHVPAKS